MWRAGIAAAALGLVATAAPAQPDGGGADSPPPLSVWRIDGASVEHLQSGLVCPEQFRTYRRTILKVFDRFGLDVGCNYLDPAQSDVTVYVTRRSGLTAADVMEDAKREFLQAHAAVHPQPISETHPTLVGLAWDVALYSVDGGMRDAIWLTDMERLDTGISSHLPRRLRGARGSGHGRVRHGGERIGGRSARSLWKDPATSTGRSRRPGRRSRG